MNKIIVIIAALMAFSSAAFAADNSVAVSETQTQKPKKAKAEIKEVNFHVHLHCANCVEKVKANIAFEKGVKDLNVTTHSITIKYDDRTVDDNIYVSYKEKETFLINEYQHTYKSKSNHLYIVCSKDSSICDYFDLSYIDDEKAMNIHWKMIQR